MINLFLLVRYFLPEMSDYPYLESLATPLTTSDTSFHQIVITSEFSWRISPKEQLWRPDDVRHIHPQILILLFCYNSHTNLQTGTELFWL